MFVNDQFSQKAHNFLSSTRITKCKYIPVFIPLQCYMSYANCCNTSFINDQLDYTKKLKINYITVNYLCASTIYENKNKDNTEFLFTSIDKIEEKKEPEIFVCIPDKFINQNMEMQTILSENHVHCFFYHEMYDFTKFPYGSYKIVVNKEINYNAMVHGHGKKTNIDRNKIPELDVVQQFQELDVRIRDCIEQMQHLHRKRARAQLKDMQTIKEYELLSKRPKLQEDDDTIQQKPSSRINPRSIRLKKSEKLFLLKNKNIFLHNPKAEQVFTEIKKKMGEKYDKEKLTCYKVNELIERFDKSAFAASLDNYLCDYIYDNIKLTMQRLDPINELIEPVWVVVLLPLRYCRKYEDIYNNSLKLRNLWKSKISRHYYVKMYKTSEKLPKARNRIVVALTQKLPVANAMTDSQVIVLLPPQFDENYKPRYDPNQFNLRAFYYADVKQIASVDYPLYEFDTNYLVNLPNKSQDFSRNDYMKSKPKIDDMTLQEYIYRSYEMFDHRDMQKAVKLQEKMIQSPIIINSYIK